MKRDFKAIVRAASILCLGGLSGLATGFECAPGEILDCFGNCAPANWVNDSYCDDGSYVWNNNPIYLDCQGWDFDGGDCKDEPFLPVSGTPVPSMAALDIAVLDLMKQEDVEAGAVGVMKDGVVVYQRFFGWKNQGESQQLQPGTMMRIASLTKSHTAACIRELIDDGVIDLNDNVFDLGQRAGGLLDIAPFNGIGDLQLANVSVDDCLRHRGGWDRDAIDPATGQEVGDHTYREIQIKQAYNQDAPPTREQTVSWILSQPLQTQPGNVYAYSNIGYLVLGLIVEQYAGKDPVEFLHERVLAPVGVLPGEVELGRTFPADRNPNEPWYDNQGSNWSNVYATLDDLEDDPQGSKVPAPDGGWNMVARVGQGGLIATPRALLTFLDNYQVAGIDIGAPRDKTNEGANWSLVHTGAFSRGTNTIAQQWSDGYCFVAMFNKNELVGLDYSVQARNAFKDLLDSGEIDVPACPPNYIQDCNGNCVPSIWLGNGACDSDTWFGGIEVDFNCEALNFDEGDCTPCPADFSGDGMVGIDDLLEMITVFGMCNDPSNCPQDLDGDGFVAIEDLLAVIDAFGPCP